MNARLTRFHHTRVWVFRFHIGWFFSLCDWPGLVFRDLSDRLNLSRDEGEKWIVNLIRETRMGADAKIDLEKVRFECSFFPSSSTRGLASIILRRHTQCPNPRETWTSWNPFWFGSWRHFGQFGVGGESSPLVLAPVIYRYRYCLTVSGHLLVGLRIDWADSLTALNVLERYYH